MSEDFSEPICTQEGEARRYVRRELVHETRRASASSAPISDAALAAPECDHDEWHWLILIARYPYRPELHYMRGPGPKWYAKHQGLPKNASL